MWIPAGGAGRDSPKITCGAPQIVNDVTESSQAIHDPVFFKNIALFIICVWEKVMHWYQVRYGVPIHL